ncbi:hydantoinase/oxoprolinase N-terminal domain-containing protein [Amycolatopsis jejuensis]|uniref:hydantoinase/oxoprolinase N-terminal domain-containing protein n=1 Tax=Amycolatopsis jejuensis TaxID=330084 RepID=UPI000527F7BB|nr:hydantoinase/oxoprolinase family protein [Amycolatopsis jejuensis]
MTGELRLGIDVGGTNTDAVVVDPEGSVLAWHKTPTTPDPFGGIAAALAAVLAETGPVGRVMLGTTHPLNAIIRRRGLAKVGILRLGAPATLSIAPLTGWPADLAAAVTGPVEIVRGGHEVGGVELAPLDEDAVRHFAERCRDRADAVAVTGVSSPMVRDHEVRAAAIITEVLGAVPVTLGHEVGGMGLLERENSAVLNAALTFAGAEIVRGLDGALQQHRVRAQVYLTQNDGTLVTAAEAARRPILTIGSGPANSMRGAAAVSGVGDAIIADVGGTSTDVGVLLGGFPRESAHAVEIGGVRTNYRMPDLVSIGLGGGTIVHPGGRIGPDSVGYRLASQALVSGGTVATLSDVGVLAGRLSFGSRTPELPPDTVRSAVAWIDERIGFLTDRIRAGRADLPLIAVGGGAGLLPTRVPGTATVIRPRHAAVANAIGAAIAEVSGSVDRVFTYDSGSRSECLRAAQDEAIEAAGTAGADRTRIRITTVTETGMSYLPGNVVRVQVKAAGPLG